MKNGKEKQPELFGHRKETSAKQTKKEAKRLRQRLIKQVTEQNHGGKVKYIYIYINKCNFQEERKGEEIVFKIVFKIIRH